MDSTEVINSISKSFIDELVKLNWLDRQVELVDVHQVFEKYDKM